MRRSGLGAAKLAGLRSRAVPGFSVRGRRGRPSQARFLKRQLSLPVSPQVGAGVEALYYSFDRDRRDFGLGQIDPPRDFVTVRGRLTFYLNGSDTPVLG